MLLCQLQSRPHRLIPTGKRLKGHTTSLWVIKRLSSHPNPRRLCSISIMNATSQTLDMKPAAFTGKPLVLLNDDLCLVYIQIVRLNMHNISAVVEEDAVWAGLFHLLNYTYQALQDIKIGLA
jgi:hypothetical protein